MNNLTKRQRYIWNLICKHDGEVESVENSKGNAIVGYIVRYKIKDDDHTERCHVTRPVKALMEKGYLKLIAGGWVLVNDDRLKECKT